MSAYSAKRLSSSVSTSAGDTNQKDVIVSQMRAEILELKQNEREYQDLSNQLKKLEQRYNVLNDEKTRGEADFKSRNTINFDTIANLRTDVDTLKATIADTKLEIQDLKVENHTNKDIADQKGTEAQQLKAHVNEANDYNNNLSDTKRRLEAELEIAREEKRRQLAQIKENRSTLDSLNYKNNELEKLMKELEYKNSKSERQNGQIQQSIDNLNGELKTRLNNLETIEQQVVDSQKAIASLEGDISYAERENEQNRVEAAQKYRTYQQEVSKGLDLSGKVTVLEASLKSKESELTGFKRDNENLKTAHSNLLDNNFQLKQELDNIKADIETTSNANAEVVEELDRLTLEDEQVRAILNRQDRVETLKFKSESQLRKSGYKQSRAQFSPSPDRNGSITSLRKSPRLVSSLRKSPYKY
jgi:chromosome segregation ATPase